MGRRIAAPALTIFIVVATVLIGCSETVFLDTIRSDVAAAELTLPPAPADLQAISLGPDSVRIVWTDTSDTETGFEIERRSAGDWEAIAVVNANTTEYIDVNLLANTDYDYQIRAFNAKGASGYCDLATAKTNFSAQTPDPVTGVSALLYDSGDSDPNTFGADVSWSWSSATTSVSAFDVEVFADGTLARTIEGLSAGARSYRDTGAFNDYTTYVYRVYARNGYGTANAASSNSLVTPVRRPTNVGVTVNSSSQLSIGWTENNSKSASYQVQYKKDGEVNWSNLTTTTSISAVHQGLAEHLLVSYRVIASISGSTSPASESSSGRTLLITPDEVDVSPRSNPTVWLYVDWEDPSTHATSWEVEITPEGGSPYVVTANTIGHTVEGLSDNDAISARIRARGPESNVSAWSAAASGRTLLSEPGSFEAKNVSETSVLLTWKDESAEADFHTVEWWADGGHSGSVNVSPGQLSYTVAVRPADTYDFKIMSWAGSPSSPTNNSLMVFVRDVSTPFNAPTSLAHVSQTHESVTISFTDNSSGETGFYVRESGNNALFATLSSRSGTGSTSRTITGLQSFDLWQIYVEAYYADPDAGVKTSSHSNSVVTYTDDEPPPPPPIPNAPSGFEIVTVRTSTSFTFTDNATNETSFVLYRRYFDGRIWTWVVVTDQLPPHTGTGTTTVGPLTDAYLQQLLPDGTNTYAIAAKNSAGTSARSNSVSFTTP